MTESDLDAYDSNGRTRLMNAAESGDYEAVQSLLEWGANPWIKDGNFSTSTALDLAQRAQKKSGTTGEWEQIIAMLQEKMELVHPPQSQRESSPELRAALAAKEPKMHIEDHIEEFLTSDAPKATDGIKIIDIDIPFVRLVRFLVKLGFAAIPAAIIIYISILFVNKILGNLG